ncbi:hypothetical protein [Salinisphaera sp. Q1T1-3]|uniref:hypothetical protein n=1 Tax=Salinisphaera sp. Q1T1-3 TaxID=2321229 RepID=UPI0011C40DD1|nr:hypothetical protein [Salinisphaera sp. Q1T1-3]
MDATHFYIGLAITNLVVLAGWVFAIKQNEAALRRERRVDAFTKAYDILVSVGMDNGIPARRQSDGTLDDYSRDFEWAIATVHLYGTGKEVKLANELVIKLTDEKFYDADALVNALRGDVRSEMGMVGLEEKPHYLKQTVTDGRKKYDSKT